MNKTNYQKELEGILKVLQESGKQWPGEGAPSLLLHSCCAPCSSYVLEYLSSFFRITVFYYNPNITYAEEYGKRVREQKRLIECLNQEGGHFPIEVKEGDYEPDRFREIARGLETCPEGGERCLKCFELRLRKTAESAGEFDYYATTLTISPLKNAEALNTIGHDLAEEYGICWLPSDFKKKNGYKRSVELSDAYGLYRQDYCGCIYSKIQRDQMEKV